MQYHHLDYEALKSFCIAAFQGYHFTEEESRKITDVLLDADLSGIESHGVQRMIRYHKEITEGLAKPDAKPEIVKETPISALIEGNDAMGQLLGIQAMDLAIQKAKTSGFGMVTVRNSNLAGKGRRRVHVGQESQSRRRLAARRGRQDGGDNAKLADLHMFQPQLLQLALQYPRQIPLAGRAGADACVRRGFRIDLHIA